MASGAIGSKSTGAAEIFAHVDTTLQEAYNADTPIPQIIPAFGVPLTIRSIGGVGDVFAVEDAAGSDILMIDTTSMVRIGEVAAEAGLKVHGLFSAGNATDATGHIFLGAYTWTTPTANLAGLGVFPVRVPGTPTAGALWGVQGNCFFGTANFGVGSTVVGLQFFPAPDYLNGSTAWGSANLELYGIQTGAFINVFSRTLNAKSLIGAAISSNAFIFGTPGTINAGIATVVLVNAPSAHSGTIGVQTGIQVDDQDISAATLAQGIWLNSDSDRGGDIVFGLGKDAHIYYDGADLVIDPQLVGTGGVMIRSMKSGATVGAAGAGTDELWFTVGHATLPDRVVMIG